MKSRGRKWAGMETFVMPWDTGRNGEHYEKGAYYFSYTLGQRMVSSI